jgi:hypothetical protein
LQLHTEVYVGTNFQQEKCILTPSVQDRTTQTCQDTYLELPTWFAYCQTALLVGDWKTGGAVGADKQLASLAFGLSKVYRTNPVLFAPSASPCSTQDPMVCLPNE